ncbi:hypothetical protein CARUB_v10028645mg [Capsella rubella]|uniref:DUF4220 domain-containing protein n=1 Tax=Capsella rubella TaxID=81985 RepID=R0F1S0_9BRAS|nr:uncharacterized protein LOC17876500 [Capsella rubella]EOA15246.1 hypothetical protein CARUB_v10028645mg [Capsella rubella]
MVQVIPAHIKNVWDEWNIRGIVILSLSLQTILILLAPLRKRTSNRFLALVLWLSYLLADWSANFVIGLIAKNQGKELKPDDLPQDKKLMALWAPFLLLHLGGPDTITAYSLEDNALWHRHFLGLALQAISGAYVVIQSLPNSLWVIILLLFIAGTLKYLERTIALYLASSDKFRGSMLEVPDSDSTETRPSGKEDDSMATENYTQYGRPLRLENPGNLTHLEILQFAFWFFNNFKSLVVNNIFSSEQRGESREFFKNLTNEEALRILEVELGFIYEGLYTKVSVLHTWVGALTRTIALGSLLSAFGIFHYRTKKSHEFHGADIVITYILFLVGIALDFVSLLMILPSDWTFAVISRINEDEVDSGSWIDPALKWLLGLKKLHWKKQICCGGVEHEVLNTPFLIQRWAGSIKLFNFIAYSVKADIKRMHDVKGRRRRLVWKTILYPFTSVSNISKKLCKKIAIWNDDLHQYMKDVTGQWSGDNPVAHYLIIIVEFWFMIPHCFTFIGSYITNFLGIDDLLDEISLIRSVHSEPLTKELWEFIFDELKSRLQRPRKERRKTKAGKKGWDSGNIELDMADPERLMRYIADVDFDRSLMLWHIATELCYQEEVPISSCDKDREFSKILSDYMMYLLIMQPKLMSEVAGIGKIRFRDTLAEAGKFYKRWHIENLRDVRRASHKILSVEIEIHPRDVKGNKSKSVLFEARALAKELNKIKKQSVDSDEESMWKVVSKVWMELLFHAASNCDATARMDQLSKGGELLIFVWLALAHLGLGSQLSSSANGLSETI